LKKPTILLIRPQMGENIGATARAMANFGLRELRLVAPRDGWPNPKASDTAGKALNIIDDASVHETVSEALADCQFVLATTARERAMNLPVMDVREAMQELHARAARGEKCAVMFGPERTGLENEDMALANAVVTIPVAPEYTSLNIGQAVVVCAYEWFMASLAAKSDVGEPLPSGEVGTRFGVSGEGMVRSFSMPSPEKRKEHFSTSPEGRGQSIAPTLPVATRAQLEGLLGQLEAALDAENFWRVPEKKDGMWRNIRATLVRAGLTEQEIATWRGMVKALAGTPTSID
jgi:tRNA/rRNA methyltransferase